MSKKQKQVSPVVIAMSIIVAAGVTGWAMIQTGLAGPQTSWSAAQDGVQRIWSPETPNNMVNPNFPPAASTEGDGQLQQQRFRQLQQPQQRSAPTAYASPVRQVAGRPGVPTIRWGVQPIHPDRGTCTNCHTVLRGNGQPVPTIFSFSNMPHGFRGVCANCHETLVQGARGVAQTIVSNAPRTAPPTMMQPAPVTASPQIPMSPANMAPGGGRPPTEGEWRGLEVRVGGQGVVVTAVDGTASRMGVMPGDVVVSINATPVRSMQDFVSVTQNGRLPRGTLIALRGNQRTAFELAPVPANPRPMVQPAMQPQMQRQMQPSWAPPSAGPANGGAPLQAPRVQL